MLSELHVNHVILSGRFHDDFVVLLFGHLTTQLYHVRDAIL